MPDNRGMKPSEMKPILLTVSAGGSVTFPEDVLKHLGIEPGGEIDFELVSDGRALIGPVSGNGSTDDSME